MNRRELAKKGFMAACGFVCGKKVDDNSEPVARWHTYPDGSYDLIGPDSKTILDVKIDN